jgi:hypothetical protein
MPDVVRSTQWGTHHRIDPDYGAAGSVTLKVTMVTLQLG